MAGTRHDPALRLAAVRAYVENGGDSRAVAKKLDVPRRTVSRWVQQAAEVGDLQELAAKHREHVKAGLAEDLGDSADILLKSLRANMALLESGDAAAVSRAADVNSRLVNVLERVLQSRDVQANLDGLELSLAEVQEVRAYVEERRQVSQRSGDALEEDLRGRVVELLGRYAGRGVPNVRLADVLLRLGEDALAWAAEQDDELRGLLERVAVGLMGLDEPADLRAWRDARDKAEEVRQ